MRKNQCRFARLLCLVMLFFISGCHENRRGATSIKYSTGVVIENIHNIDSTAQSDEEPSIALINGSYVVNVVGDFDCTSTIHPFLLPYSDNSFSLFLTPDFASARQSDDCRKQFSLKISSRLKPGDVVYILDGYAVVGHIQAP